MFTVCEGPENCFGYLVLIVREQIYKESDIRKIDYYLLYVKVKLLLRGRNAEGIIFFKLL